MDELLGTIDIAELLGCSRQRAHQLANSKGFPDPVAVVNKQTNVWSRDDVVAWVERNKYSIAPTAPRA